MKELFMSRIKAILDRHSRTGWVPARIASDSRKAGSRIHAIFAGGETSRSGSDEVMEAVDGTEYQNVVAIRSSTDKDRAITVLVADDHPVVREGLVTLINRQSDMRVVAEATNGGDAIEQFFAHRPRVALLDLRMSAMGGIEALSAICERDPMSCIVIISSYHNEEDVYRALRAGAKGYVVKEAPISELIECVRAVGTGGTWVPPLIGAKLAKRIGDRDLTPREVDVIRMVVRGKSNKEIGNVFNISESTVKVHMTHILEKLKVSGRTEAINVAVRRGLVRLEDSLAS
jgi:two-component system NarL family response regulator